MNYDGQVTRPYFEPSTQVEARSELGIRETLGELIGSLDVIEQRLNRSAVGVSGVSQLVGQDSAKAGQSGSESVLSIRQQLHVLQSTVKRIGALSDFFEQNI